MDELITKSLNRLWHNSKKIAKHQIGEFCRNNKQDGIEMNEEISEPKVKYISNCKNITNFDKSNENNIIINESFIDNITNDTCKITNEVKIDHTIPSDNNNLIELITVKMLEPPVKNVVSFVHFNNRMNNIKTEEETKFDHNVSKTDSSLFDVQINSTAAECDKIDTEKVDTHETKDKKSVIKVKIIVPKGSVEKIKDSDGPFSQSNKFVFESRVNDTVTVKNTCVLSRPNSPVENTRLMKNHEAKNEVAVESACIFNGVPKLESVAEKQTNGNACIFEENRSRPLSPISSETKNNEPVSNVQFPKKQSNYDVEPAKSVYRHSVPIMGRAALLAKVQRPIDKSTLNDSEIISDLVRDRFIINAYKSNTLQKVNNNFSRNNKLYKSFDVQMCNDRSKNKINEPTNIIHITQSSPIKLGNHGVPLIAPPIQHKTIDDDPEQISEFETESNLDSNQPDDQIQNNFCCNKKETFSNNERVESKKNNFNKTCDDASTTETKNICKKLSSSEPNIFPEIQNHNTLSSIIEIKQIEKLEMPSYSVCNSESTFPMTDNSSRCSLATDDLPSIEGLACLNNFSSLDSIPTFEDFFTQKQTRAVENEVAPQKLNKINSKNVSFEEPTTNDEENSKETSILNELSSYDMDEFLKKALGDELLDETTTTLSAAAQDQVPRQNEKIIPEDSICTSDASDLISKSTMTINSNFYNSFTKKLRKIGNNLRNTPTVSENQSEEDLNSILPNNDVVNDLVRKAAAQYEAMKQISKALTLCRNTKEFSGSVEQIEGERLLLVAIHKRQALLNEIRRIDYDLDDNSYPSVETGTITINNINFPLKDNTENDSINPKEYRQWFVCVLSQGSNVLATQIVLVKEKGPIVFPEEFTFIDLPTDFIINIEVFSLLQRQNMRNYSHDSKFHLNKYSKSTHCPSPKNFLQKDKHAQKILSRCDTGVLVSSFKSVGSLKIKVADISKTGPWQLRKIPLSSNIFGLISMNIKSTVKIPIKQSGFLTVGKKIGNSISWNRLWCMLNGHFLYFWNYPCDENDAEPLDVIDLKKCVNASIEPADRSMCPRPRTLLLETNTSKESDDFNTYFFQVDTLSEMNIWNAQLNKIVSATRTWNDSYFSQ